MWRVVERGRPWRCVVSGSMLLLTGAGVLLVVEGIVLEGVGMFAIFNARAPAWARESAGGGASASVGTPGDSSGSDLVKVPMYVGVKCARCGWSEVTDV